MKNYLRFEFLPNTAQKLLANLAAIANRVELAHLIMPRKIKGTNSTTVSSERRTDKVSPRRPTGTKKSKAGGKKSANTGISKSCQPASTPEPSDEEIRLRAYFISERRHRFAMPGDTSSDWLDAKRQLLSEVGPG